MQPQRVRVAASANASRSLSNVCRLLHDCICGMPTQRFPTHVLRLDFAAQRDLWMLPAPRNKRNDHHRARKSLVVKVELHGDKGRGRID
jgi:hypothetical protein